MSNEVRVDLASLVSRFHDAINITHKIAVVSQRLKPVEGDSIYRAEVSEIAANESPDTADLHYSGRATAVRSGTFASHFLAGTLRILTFRDEYGQANSALYALCRSTIEAAAIAGYLLQPDITLNTRLLRSAQLEAWSEWNAAEHIRKFPSRTGPGVPDDGLQQMVSLFSGAEIALKGRDSKQPWQKLERRGETIGRFKISTPVSDIHQSAPEAYGILSGVSHVAPWVTARRSEVTRLEDDGEYISTDFLQSEICSIVACACESILAAYQRKCVYYGYAATMDSPILLDISAAFDAIIAVLIEMETNNDDSGA